VTSDGRLFYSAPVTRPKVSFADLSRIGDAGYSPTPLRTSIRGGQMSPVYSPDGRLLAYVAEEPRSSASGPAATRLVIRELESGSERAFGQATTGLRIAGGYSSNFFSPDSRRVLVQGYEPTRNRRVIAAIDAETGDVQTIRTQGEDDHMYPADWVDARTVLVRNQTTREENGKRQVRSVLMALDVESGEAHDIYMQGRLNGAGALTLDRREIVFLEGFQHDDGSRKLQLSVIPLDGGEPRALLPLAQEDDPINSLTLSPDGQTVYFSKRRSELWRVPFEGGEAEPVGLTVEDGNVRQLTIHPDGRRIAFQSGERRVDIWALENFLGSTTD
jgi:Tol biopolymer transport system component